MAPGHANPKYASLVIDADTGTIISQRHADKRLHPASLTKMMTLLMVFEALDRGAIKPSDRIRVSNRAAKAVPSKLYLKAGSSIRVEDAIYALVTKSANDVAVAVAEFLGGTESRFASQMTARARLIGMRNTRFKNASGLHHKSQVSTAKDMAMLAQYILKRYPHYYRYFSTRNFKYNGKSYRNHNRLMDDYRGMDGFKTGYINASGFNLVASARRDGRRLIGVVFGGRSTKTRNAHMAKILDAGFEKSKNIRFAALTPPVPPAKPIQLALANNVQPSAGSPGYQQPQFASLNLETKAPVLPSQNNLTQALEEGKFAELSGEGDIDPQASDRIETGLIAVSAHRGNSGNNQQVAQKPRVPQAKIQTAQVTNVPDLDPQGFTNNQWAIQIGAFNTRSATNDALIAAKQKLPADYQNAFPILVPLNTSSGTIFRARLSGLSQKEAFRACTFFHDCMPIAPAQIQARAQ
ncbi:MAG: D-alanyl-D-alanine carboxypeptidase family protein [Pseudomonadota bacterium]